MLPEPDPEAPPSLGILCPPWGEGVATVGQGSRLWVYLQRGLPVVLF